MLTELEQYINSLSLDKSENTIKTYRKAIEEMLSFFHVDNVEQLNNMTVDNCFDYQIALKRAGLSASSINLKIMGIKVFFDFLKSRKKISENNWKEIRALKVPHREQAFLSDEEIQAVLDNCKRYDDKVIFMVLITTGMRNSEFCNLRIDQIEGDRIHIIGKGNKERVIKLTSEVFDLLQKYIVIRNRKFGNSVPYVFVTQIGTQFTGQGLRFRVSSLMRKAGFSEERINEIHAHTMRHTFTANLIGENINLSIVQAALGHSSINTTIKYAHLKNKVLDEALDTQNLKYRI